MAKKLKIKTSGFALLDVTDGRRALAHHFREGGAPLPIVLVGKITGQWGGDDGTSIEFEGACALSDAARAIAKAEG